MKDIDDIRIWNVAAVNLLTTVLHSMGCSCIKKHGSLAISMSSYRSGLLHSGLTAALTAKPMNIFICHFAQQGEAL